MRNKFSEIEVLALLDEALRRGESHPYHIRLGSCSGALCGIDNLSFILDIIGHACYKGEASSVSRDMIHHECYHEGVPIYEWGLSSVRLPSRYKSLTINSNEKANRIKRA